MKDEMATPVKTKSHMKRIGISHKDFNYLMAQAESSVNRICGENNLIYFCNENRSSEYVGLILYIMGFDEDQIQKGFNDLLDLCRKLFEGDGKDIQNVANDLPKTPDLTRDQSLLRMPSNQLSKSKTTSELVHLRTSCVWQPGDEAVVKTPNNINVRVFCEDLVKRDTESIVCLTNSRLQCIERGSKAVAAAIGCRHAEDTAAFLRSHGSLKPCQAMHTDPGNLYLTVRAIINVAAPDLIEPSKQHLLLEDLYFNCLQYANDELKVVSVSVPFYQSELCPVPCPVVASAICKALVKFDEQFVDPGDKQQQTLREVQIACFEQKIVTVQMMTFSIFLSRMRRRRKDVSGSQLSVCSEQSWLSPAASSIRQKHLTPIVEEVWWKETIKSHSDSLEIKICIANGFHGELLKLGVFESKTLQYAMENESEPKKVRYLLHSLIQGDDEKFENFCHALRRSGQEHIVSEYFSDRSGVKVPKSRLPRSVSDSWIQNDLRLLQLWKVQNLQTFHNELTETIISDSGLMACLRSRHVFTDHQMAELEAERHESSRNQLMLLWLEKGSEGTHMKFCTALQKNKQEHIVANYLLALRGATA